MFETPTGEQQISSWEGKIERTPSPSFLHGLIRNFLILMRVILVGFFPAPVCLCGEEIPQTSAPNQKPPSPAITYQNGELTIEAHHSRLNDILHEVSKQTGAAVEIPPGIDPAVSGRVGPGLPVDVLARMLKSLGFDYAILGSVAYPKVPVRVILFPKPGKSRSAQGVQGSPPTEQSTDLPPEVAVEDLGSGNTEDQQNQVMDHFLTIQQQLIERINARAKQ